LVPAKAVGRNIGIIEILAYLHAMPAQLLMPRKNIRG